MLQLFYSCLSALVVDVVGDGPKDHPFALVTRVRGASFGLGALTDGSLASLPHPVWMRVGVAANIVTFLIAAGIVWVGLDMVAHRRGAASLLAVTIWLPWAVIAAILLLALVVLAWLARVLPRDAVHVQPAGGVV